MTPVGCVIVEEPIGSSSFARCVADEFERGYLTITAIDNEVEVKVFRPGMWRWADMLDTRGNLMAHFVAPGIPERQYQERAS